MKKYSFTIVALLCMYVSLAQNEISASEKKQSKKAAKKEKIANLIKQAEEGTLVYRRQSIFGLQVKTNGYGLFYELGIMKTPRRTMVFRIDLSETKHVKEEKLDRGTFFSNPFIYGKQNYFYPLTLGFGQQHILGQKGNKNGVAVSLNYNAGLSLGLLRPYYVNIDDGRTIKYSEENHADFLDPNIISGSAGFAKGWKELQVKPGGFGKLGLRFDYGRFNETVTALEIGVNAEIYSSEIPILLLQEKNKQFFFNSYISILFGGRK